MKKTFKEFKEFIQRGNVMDMAIGVIIGGAFGAIVTSLVNDIIMPLISLLTGGVDFTNWFVALDGNKYETLEAAQTAGAATLNYGNLISVVINFIIVAFCIFLVVKAINKLKNLKKKEEEAAEEAPTKSDEVLLLEDIRDLLKKQNKKEK
ncbi:MAG: large conductance mechanosensitive channel protein MscL [Bacilli bacterium]|nr:large conductance mechanosensitive channel protein MscL [Bacilli bacterium]